MRFKPSQTTLLGKPYNISDYRNPPRNARCKLVYWGVEVFCITIEAAERFRQRLGYYQWEDAEIVSLR
jgi:hypothetical protein